MSKIIGQMQRVEIKYDFGKMAEMQVRIFLQVKLPLIFHQVLWLLNNIILKFQHLLMLEITELL